MPSRARLLSREIVADARAAVTRAGAPLAWASAAAMGAVMLPVAWSLLRTPEHTTIDSTEIEFSRQWAMLFDEMLVLAAQSAWTMVVAIPLCYGASSIALEAIHGARARPTEMLGAFRRPGAFAVVISVLALFAVVPTLLWMVVAVVVGAAVGIAAMQAGATDERMLRLVTLSAVASGLPFLLVSLYFQGRYLLAGMVLLDKSTPRVGAGAALARAWRMTKRQDA